MTKLNTSKKKQLIRWFMNSFQLKNKDTQWLLSFMLSSDELIESCQFIDNVDKINDRTLIISTACSDNTPFLYKMKGKTTFDVSEAFADLRLNTYDTVYMYLSFKGNMSNQQYIDVIDNRSVQIGAEKLIAEILTDKILHKHKVSMIYDEINKALDSGDRDSFMKLSKIWNELKELNT